MRRGEKGDIFYYVGILEGYTFKLKVRRNLFLFLWDGKECGFGVEWSGRIGYKVEEF